MPTSDASAFDSTADEQSSDPELIPRAWFDTYRSVGLRTDPQTGGLRMKLKTAPKATEEQKRASSY